MNHKEVIVYLALLAGLFTTIDSRAGHDVGSGGNSVVCYSDFTQTSIKSIELFDYWEMSQQLGNIPGVGKIDLGAPNLSVKEKINLAIARIPKIDSTRAARYQASADAISDHIEDYLMDQIPTVNDDHSQFKPDLPCVKVQFAVQYRDPTPGKPRFFILRSLYQHPKMTNEVRAGIILHEVIYREAIIKGQTTSDNARQFNFLLATKYFEQVPGSYLGWMNALGMGYDDCVPHFFSELNATLFIQKERPGHFCAGTSYSSKNFSFDIDSAGVGNDPSDGNALSIDISSGKLQISLNNSQALVTANQSNAVQLVIYPDGQFKVSNRLGVWSNGIAAMVNHQKIPCIINGLFTDLRVYNDGLLKECKVEDGFTFTQDRTSFKIRAFTAVTFSSNGRLLTATTDGPYQLAVEGTSFRVGSDDFTLNESGNLVKARSIVGIVRDLLDDQGQVAIPSQTISSFENVHNGIATTLISHYFGFSTIQGFPVIYYPGITEDQFCKSINPQLNGQDLIKDDFSFTSVVFANGPQKYYDIASHSVVTKIDEPVRVLGFVTSGHCSGSFQFKVIEK